MPFSPQNNNCTVVSSTLLAGFFVPSLDRLRALYGENTALSVSSIPAVTNCRIYNMLTVCVGTIMVRRRCQIPHHTPSWAQSRAYEDLALALASRRRLCTALEAPQNRCSCSTNRTRGIKAPQPGFRHESLAHWQTYLIWSLRLQPLIISEQCGHGQVSWFSSPASAIRSQAAWAAQSSCRCLKK